MANGVQLATAYISLNVDTRNVKNQILAAASGAGGPARSIGSSMGSNILSGLQAQLSGNRVGALFTPLTVGAARAASRAGTTIAVTLRNAIAGAMKTVGAGLAVGGGLGVGSVLLAGLDRLKVLQGAQVQLRVMKKSAEEIRQITDDVLSVVQGTPISLDAAMQAVPQALGAGVKQGQELKQYIQDIGDAAASTGGKAGFGQISMIFSQILGKGRLMSEEVLQLEENGVRVRNALKQSLGVDDQQLSKMIEQGKVGMKEVQAAVQSTLGGLSKQMGSTFEGATSNMKAAAARLGANILGVIFGDPENPDDPLSGATEGVNKLTDALDGASQWVKDNRQSIRNVFTGIGDAANGVVAAVKSVVDWFKKVSESAADVGRKIKEAFDTGTGAVGRLYNKIVEVVNKVKTGVEDIVNRITDFVKNSFNSVFGPDSAIGKILATLGIGMPTAGAAAPGAPFNPGPSKPTVVPGTIGAGSGGSLGTSSLGVSGTVGGKLSSTINPGPAKQGVIMSAGTPYGLPAGTDTGGYGNPNAQNVFPPWVFQLGDRFDVKPSTYAGHQEGSGSNRGIDWVGSVEQMQAFAEFLTKSKIPGLEQVIWQNPGTGQPLGLTPDGQVVNDPNGYYRDDWSGHQDHVHTRFSQNLDLAGFAAGGKISGPGTATSDSIPAMLSNGEHVLTAADVKKMGGQDSVYRFRRALQMGLIPGFETGGAVDPNVVLDARNQLADAQNAAIVAQQQFNETLNNADATEMDKTRARQGMQRSQRSYQQQIADFPVIAQGGTPPDRSAQNQVFDVTDQLELAQLALADLQSKGDAPVSQMTASQYEVERLKREREQAVKNLQDQQNPQTNYLDEFVRNAGFVPVAAGNTGVAGTSSLSGILNMGSEIAGGLIDTGASLAQTAVSAAAAAGTFGAGAAAAPAAGFGIQMGANMLKRGVSFGFQSAGILADSIIAQLFPFGAPRWIGYDYTQLMPQMGLQQAAITTIEKMGSDAINRYFNPGQQPVIPTEPQSPASTLSQPQQLSAEAMVPGAAGQIGVPQPMQGSITMEPPKPWDPNWLAPPNMTGAGGGGGGGSWATGGAVKIYDDGGVLKPGDLALNASTRPERVLTDKQWDALSKIAPANQGPLVKIDAIYGMSPEDVAAKIEAKQKLAMMRYSGRP